MPWSSFPCHRRRSSRSGGGARGRGAGHRAPPPELEVWRGCSRTRSGSSSAADAAGKARALQKRRSFPLDLLVRTQRSSETRGRRRPTCGEATEQAARRRSRRPARGEATEQRSRRREGCVVCREKEEVIFAKCRQGQLFPNGGSTSYVTPLWPALYSFATRILGRHVSGPMAPRVRQGICVHMSPRTLPLLERNLLHLHLYPSS